MVMIVMILRMLPLLILGFTMYQGYGYVQNIFGRTFNTVKSALVLYEMSSIRTMLSYEFVENGRIPKNQKEFYEFMRNNFESQAGRDKTKDVFGSPYIYRKTSEGAEIRSAGPDRKPFTRDDIKMIFRQ